MKTMTFSQDLRKLLAATALTCASLLTFAQPAAPGDPIFPQGYPIPAAVVADFKVMALQGQIALQPRHGSAVIEVPLGDSLVLAYAGTPGATCEWDFGQGSSILGATDQRFAYAAIGTYAITQTVIGEGGSSETKQQIVRVVEKLRVGAMAAHGGSVSSYRFEVFTDLNGAPGKLRITDLHGRDVMTPIQTNVDQGSLDLGTLDPGDYLIRVESAQGTRLARVRTFRS